MVLWPYKKTKKHLKLQRNYGRSLLPKRKTPVKVGLS